MASAAQKLSIPVRRLQVVSQHVTASTPTAAYRPLRQLADQARLLRETRERLGVDDTLPDRAILASLQAVAAGTTQQARWRAAFNSPLGRWLALRGCDLTTAIDDILTMLAVERPYAVGGTQ